MTGRLWVEPPGAGLSPHPKRLGLMSSGWIGLIAAIALAGCKTLPEKPASAGTTVAGDWGARKSELQGRQQFQFKGRVAVAAGGEGFNARLLWQQSGSQSFVALDGPLGAGGVQITQNGPSLTVTTSHGDRLDSDAAHGELKSKLGFDPPIGSLRYWVLGVPDPTQASQETLNAQHRLGGLKQEDWDISYEAYGESGSDMLPSRVTLQRQGVRIRLIVDGWTL